MDVNVCVCVYGCLCVCLCLSVNLERPCRVVLDFQISRFFRVAGRCHDVLTEWEFGDSPFFLFNFEASPRRNFPSNFSILFPGPCPTGCFFSRLVTSLYPPNFCLMLLPLTRVYGRTSFSGLRRCVCVFRSSSSDARDPVLLPTCQGFAPIRKLNKESVYPYSKKEFT